MADSSNGINYNLEKELQCAICTDVLYQPLTLLDCLHTFCGSCLKEWFAWQATSASHSRRNARPYTCPSCREPVRDTKADFRTTALLEGFLKGSPDKGKSDLEKDEMRKHYKPGDNVLPPVQQREEEDNSEDERLLARVRDMSMAGGGTESGRRAAERASRQRGGLASDTRQQYDADGTRRRQDPSHPPTQQTRLTESRLRQHDAQEPHIEHQPSLRSLLSASAAGSQDMQAEVMQSIIDEGLLDGIDTENLTPEQEEELTERIAEAYTRRRRQAERSRNRERRNRDSSSPQPAIAGTAARSPQRSQTDLSTSQQQSRPRPPISRPHLFEQNLQEPPRERRSTSARSDRSNRSAIRNEEPSPAGRSATDLSQQPSTENAQRPTRNRLSSAGRSVTDPENPNFREQVHRYRASSNTAIVDGAPDRPQSSSTHTLENIRRRDGPSNNSASSLPTSPPPSTAAPQHSVRPAISTAAFAPEPVTGVVSAPSAPSIKCDRCERPGIQHELHYNCPWCLEGAFNLCFRCYRGGQGCNHWFGFGFRAFERWHRAAPPEGWPPGFEGPHTLAPRRYTNPADNNTQAQRSSADSSSGSLQEGAFCESCFAFADGCYWYCNVCLEGAWGFCDKCVQQDKHCTHPLLLVAHTRTLHQPHYDLTKLPLVGLPHLQQSSYVAIPVTTDCDICHRAIPPNNTRFHCYQCSDGDYDMCNECYRSLVAQGKISQANGPTGWRRCLKGHRMAVVGFQDTHGAGHLRMTVREQVGGRAFKEDEVSLSGQMPPGGLPPDGGIGMRCLALYNYLPPDGAEDELAFPKNAEIREVENRNGDWYWGVYAGAINLFPSNHVRQI